MKRPPDNHPLDLAPEQVITDPDSGAEVELPRSLLPNAGASGGAANGRGLSSPPPDVAPDRDRGSDLRRWLDDSVLAEVRLGLEHREARGDSAASWRELPADIDSANLAETGWGVILPERPQPGLREALRPLLQHRRGAARKRFRALRYRRGDTGRRFLEDRMKQPPGVIDPRRLPYFVTLIGGPESIPFEFQYQLNISHAVGRLYFEDLEGYRRYADQLVQTEREGSPLPSTLSLFCVEHEEDLATQRLAQHLVAPLAEGLADAERRWNVEVWRGERAHKQDLRKLLGGATSPGALLVACHGLRAVFGDAGRPDLQGALICQDQPPEAPVERRHLFAAADVPASARLDGLIAVLLACHGAGTPVLDSYPNRNGEPTAEVLSARPLLAALPQQLLLRGALAVLGHIDRGWTTSFSWLMDGSVQAAAGTFEDIFRRLLEGQRLGHALRPIYRRYTALAAHLAPLVERVVRGEAVDPGELRSLRIAANDARNFVLLGDPAVQFLGGRRQP